MQHENVKHENLKKGLYFGIIGNILFVAFGIVAIFFYYTYKQGSIFSRVLEIIAYATEITGFGLLVYSDYLLISSIRLRKLLKISYSAYIIIEALMMVLELTGWDLEIYKPYSLTLAIIHAVVSAACCLAFLQLDPDNVRFEVVISGCIVAILVGMLGNIFGVRVYFSIIVNAVSFAVMFRLTKFLYEREDMKIDCKGDNAREAVFNASTLFADPEGDPESEPEVVEADAESDTEKEDE